MFNITSKYFNFFNNKPLASWVAHLARDSLTCYSSSYYSSMVKGVRIWSFSSPYSVRMQENTDQKNSAYGHFLLSLVQGTYFENRFDKRKGSVKLKIGSIISSVISFCCNRPEELPNSFLTGFIIIVCWVYKFLLSC